MFDFFHFIIGPNIILRSKQLQKIKSAKIMQKQVETEQTEFICPLPFEEFVEERRNQEQSMQASFTIKDLTKVRKLKKILQQTEEKINNRINLFRKVSNHILKKKWKEKQNMINESRKLAELDENKAYSGGHRDFRHTNHHNLTIVRSRKRSAVEKNENSFHRMQVILDSKIINAKQLKNEKKQNKILIEKRKEKELRDKHDSAKQIRCNRIKAQEIRQQYRQQRQQQARKQNQERWKDEIQKYKELQSNLYFLQKQERDALIIWKRVMEDD